MREILNDLLHEHMYLHILLICLCVGGMLVAMAVDLFFGIKKAKALGMATTSTGYKKTCEKGRKYINAFFCADVHRPYRLHYTPCAFLLHDMGGMVHILRV